MNHLTDERLYLHIFDQIALAGDEIAHLSTCKSCQENAQTFSTLSNELALARLSTPGQEVLNAYYQLFAQVETKPSFLARSLQWVKFQLQWDSRQQPALQGVRGTSSPSYRLLYSCDIADIEFLVEARNGNRQIEGEIIPLEENGWQFPALLQFSSQSDNETVCEVECDQNGRFRVESLIPGTYVFSLLPRHGAQLQIEMLGLT